MGAPIEDALESVLSIDRVGQETPTVLLPRASAQHPNCRVEKERRIHDRGICVPLSVCGISCLDFNRLAGVAIIRDAEEFTRQWISRRFDFLRPHAPGPVLGSGKTGTGTKNKIVIFVPKLMVAPHTAPQFH